MNGPKSERTDAKSPIPFSFPFPFPLPIALTRPSLQSTAYYARELGRRVHHYARVRRRGYPHRGSLEEAAAGIISERTERGFRPGAHFRGIWPRDLCFSAPGIVARGYADELRRIADWLVAQFDDVFYTDVQDDFGAAVPLEGIDTFPALVILFDEVGRVQDHADRLEELAALHRERFFDASRHLVSGPGSGWWDSAAKPRVAYNTAMLLAALERLESAAVETTYTGEREAVRDAWLDRLWTGRHFAERPDSSVLACDANVVPLYFGLVEPSRARSIADALERLETPRGIKLRERPFSIGEVHPFFALHRDYHYHVWPWNSFVYAIGLDRYGLEERASREVARVERTLRRYGTFLECYTLEGEPYVKRGYAAAGDFTTAAALWTQYHRQRGRKPSEYSRSSGPLDGSG